MIGSNPPMWDISQKLTALQHPYQRKTENRARRQSGFPTFISCQRQDANVLPKRRQSHQGDKLCDVSTVPLVARWPVFLARGSDADGEPHCDMYNALCIVSNLTLWTGLLYPILPCELVYCIQSYLVNWSIVSNLTLWTGLLYPILPTSRTYVARSIVFTPAFVTMHWHLPSIPGNN